MSRKKERKIKKLQHLSVGPVVFEIFLRELVIYAVTGLICFFAIVGAAYTVILQNDKECFQIVKAVEELWENQESDAAYAESEKKINILNETFDGVDSIYVIQKKDNSVQKIFGSQSGAVEKFLKSPIPSDFENHGILFSSDENPHLIFDIYEPANFFKVINSSRLFSDLILIEWAQKERLKIYATALFKTKNPDILVCMHVKYSVNAFQSNFVINIILIFAAVIILCGFFGFSRLMRYVKDAHRINLLVTTDPVTGGFNKEYFMQKAKRIIKKPKKNYAVIQLRLEKYRNFCIAYGTKEGENLLEKMNGALNGLLEKKEIAAHIEKADFALLLAYDDNASLETRLHKIMNALRENHESQYLTFSAGICAAHKKDDVASLLAYSALAVPKEIKVQDEIVWFNDSMKDEQIWERKIEDDMQAALEKHEFQVYLQPKYSTKKEKLSAAEALVRWIHPTLGFISPGKFIPIFEKNGFILQLDDYMLTEVSKIQADWLSKGKTLVPISVNVSRAHFAEDNLAGHICSVVDKYNVPHEFIELELTESAFFDDKTALLDTIMKLKSFGFKVSMDDFGAGYSSLNSLKELPLDIIKLDAEFFRNVEDAERSKLIVSQTISLAKKLGMQIVAEGIETREQVDFLANQNCDLIQGFYFSKPLPLNEFEERAYPEKNMGE